MLHACFDGGFAHLPRDKSGEYRLDKAAVVQKPSKRWNRQVAPRHDATYAGTR